eukprot:3729338-Pleurochrysis_carterae.AAC.3
MAAKGVFFKCAHSEGKGALSYTPDGRQAAPAMRRIVLGDRLELQWETVSHLLRNCWHITARLHRRRMECCVGCVGRGYFDQVNVLLCRAQIVTGGEDTLIKIFQAEDLDAEPRTIEHHEAPITALAIDRKARLSTRKRS